MKNKIKTCSQKEKANEEIRTEKDGFVMELTGKIKSRKQYILEHMNCVAAELKVPTLLFEMNMGIQELTERLLCNATRIEYEKDKIFTEEELKKIKIQGKKYLKAPVYINTEIPKSKKEFTEKIMKCEHDYGLHYVIIDGGLRMPFLSEMIFEERKDFLVKTAIRAHVFIIYDPAM